MIDDIIWFKMRSKMLSSMDTVLESANDPGMVDKALKASATVTANSDQMPLNNQVWSNIFEIFLNSISLLIVGKRCEYYWKSWC